MSAAAVTRDAALLERCIEEALVARRGANAGVRALRSLDVDLTTSYPVQVLAVELRAVADVVNRDQVTGCAHTLDEPLVGATEDRDPGQANHEVARLQACVVSEAALADLACPQAAGHLGQGRRERALPLVDASHREP